jgi:hypothetical protein
MAMIWRESNDGYVGEPLRMDGDAGVAIVAARVGGTSRGFRIAQFRDGTTTRHALVAGSDVPIRVNGQAIAGGFRVMHHKDELVMGAERMFFSAESTPVVEAYRHDESRRRPRCAVCRAEVLDGQSVVRCPGCSRVYHQIAASDDAPEKPCWTYAPKCRFCEHPTSLSGEPSWRPECEQNQLISEPTTIASGE